MIATEIVARYADDIAFVADEAPATTLATFVSQVQIAAETLATARITGAEDLETAATCLADADRVAGSDRDVLLAYAAHHLQHTNDMVGEYRRLA